MCHSPLKLVLRMYFSRVFPSADSICGQTPGWSGHKSLCMLWRAWAMAYTASITNCTFPSCSYLESIPMRSWPEGKKKRERWTNYPNASWLIRHCVPSALTHHLQLSIVFKFWRNYIKSSNKSLIWLKEIKLSWETKCWWQIQQNQIELLLCMAKL